MSPDGSTNQLTLKPDLLYQRFGMACMANLIKAIYNFISSLIKNFLKGE